MSLQPWPEQGERLDRNALIAKLQAYFSRQPEVRLAYLYGSVATGQMWAESDLDVGVLFDDALTPHERFRRALRMCSEVEEALDRALEADARELNDAPVEFQYQVYYHGCCLYARDENERVSFETRVMREYFDFVPVLEEYYREMFRRIKTGEASAQLRRYETQIRQAVARARETQNSPAPLTR